MPDQTPERGELRRVTEEVAARLAARGIHLRGNETPNEITDLEDAVEEFEEAVESHGGDLMIDEPPPSGHAQPDNPLFLLPARTPEMSVAKYVDVLIRATRRIRARRSQP